MRTVRDLRTVADQKLLAGSYLEALHIYTLLVELQPLELSSRLRVGDALLASGQVTRAAKVYVELARQAASSGYPLYSMVVLKVLAALDSQFSSLTKTIAELYAAGSVRMGRGIRPAPPDPNQLLPPNLKVSDLPENEKAYARGEAVGSSYDYSGIFYPDKLPPMPLMSLLPASDFISVFSEIKLVRVPPGALIIKEGDAGYSFYLLARGTVWVGKKGANQADIELARLHAGSVFGEMALLSTSPRTATVRAISDCDLLEFNSESLASTSKNTAGVARALTAFTQERLVSNLLSTAALFRPLDDDQRRDLMRRFIPLDAEPGTILIGEGEPGRGLFLVLRGVMEVTKREGNRKVTIAKLAPGDVFGEISLLNNEPTTATVVAVEKSTVLFLGREYFQRLVDAVTEIRAYVERLGEQRMLDLRLSEVPALEEKLDEREIEILR
jgi:CRP-like cAMP-binding protein